MGIRPLPGPAPLKVSRGNALGSAPERGLHTGSRAGLRLAPPLSQVSRGNAPGSDPERALRTGSRARPSPSHRSRTETRLAPPPERGLRTGSRAGPRPAPPLSQFSRGNAPGSAPPSAAARPSAQLGPSPARCAGSLLVKRNGFILVVSVLAAVGGTGLYHPSGPQLLHFCRPSRQLRLLSVSPRSALIPSLLL